MKVVGKRGKGKGKSVGAAMRESGYSAKYADNPQKLTNTKSWTTLLEENLSDEVLAQHHSELLNAKEIGKFDFPLRFTDADIKTIVEEDYGFKLMRIVDNVTDIPRFRRRKAYYLVPNTKAKKDAIDMGYKLKGKYEAEKHSVKFDGYTKEELIKLIAGRIGGNRRSS